MLCVVEICRAVQLPWARAKIWREVHRAGHKCSKRGTPKRHLLALAPLMSYGRAAILEYGYRWLVLSVLTHTKIPQKLVPGVARIKIWGGTCIVDPTDLFSNPSFRNAQYPSRSDRQENSSAMPRSLPQLLSLPPQNSMIP